MAAFRLTSPAFEHDTPLPLRYSGDADDLSPPLAWTGAPAGTKELVLICDDPDAETGVFTHWIVYGMAPDSSSLPEGISDDAIIEGDDISLVQGLNEFDQVGWNGPIASEERGPHRLFFRLYALDTELLDLPPGVTRSEVRNAAKDHIIGQTMLVGIV
ncbi:MAG: YbhB/YbcL family Raf kinase inhibitor-like protein [Egibacteraceae bacterium]